MYYDYGYDDRQLDAQKEEYTNKIISEFRDEYPDVAESMTNDAIIQYLGDI